MKKKGIVSLLLVSSLLATGTAAALRYIAVNKGKEEQPDIPEEPEQPESEEEPEQAEEPEQDEDGEAEQEELPEEEPAKEDLESYLEQNPEEEESLNAIKDSFSADGVETDINVEGNKMVFHFIMADVEDEETRETIKPDLEAFLEDQSSPYADIVRDIEGDTGIDGILMTVVFEDANDAAIVSGQYDDSGRMF